MVVTMYGLMVEIITPIIIIFNFAIMVIKINISVLVIKLYTHLNYAVRYFIISI